jgi:hypothetical protein
VPSYADRWEGRTRAAGDILARAWSNYLSRIPWEFFASLTFDPKRVFPVSRECASREAFWWCGSLGHLYRRTVTWIYVVERGHTGLWHAHALIIGAGEQPRWLAALETWRERNGKIDLQPVSDVRGVAMYTTKELAAEGEIVLSDTLARYKNCLASSPVVDLFPGS